MKGSADDCITKPHGVTLRSIVIGLFCVVLLCAYVPYNDYYVQGTFLAGNHFPIGAVFLLIVFVLVINVVLKLATKGSGLSPSELATIWKPLQNGGKLRPAVLGIRIKLSRLNKISL